MTYVTSDLHGYPLEKFKALLKKAEFSEKDRLIIIGDVIDRGAESAKLLLWIMEQKNVELLLGNHEDMMLGCEFLFSEVDDIDTSELSERELLCYMNWMKNGGDETVAELKRLSGEKRREIFDFVSDCAMYKTLDIGSRRFVLVHGGLGNFSPERELCDYSSRELLWERPMLWENYSYDFITVFGHTPTLSYSREYRGRMIKTSTWINIDTGVTAGLDPMLLRLEDLKEFYQNTYF